MVPQSCDIDITNYLPVPTDLKACVTPVAQNRNVKKSLSVRRKGSPITWKTTSKVNKMWNDDEDDNPSTFSPPYSTRETKPRAKLVRRILVNDLSDDITEDSVQEDAKTRNHRTGNRNSTQKKLTQDIKTSLIASDLSRNLDFDMSDVPVTENKLIDEVESLDVSETLKSAKNTKRLTTINYNANANQELFDKLSNLTIKEKTSDNADSLTLTEIEKGIKGLQIPKISVINDEEKSNEIAGKQSAQNASKLSANKTETTRKFFKHTRLNTKFEVYSTRTTRSSVRKKKEKE